MGVGPGAWVEGGVGALSNKGSNEVQGLLGSQPLTRLYLSTILIYIKYQHKGKEYYEMQGTPFMKKMQDKHEVVPPGQSFNTLYEVQGEEMQFKWF